MDVGTLSIRSGGIGILARGVAGLLVLTPVLGACARAPQPHGPWATSAIQHPRPAEPRPAAVVAERAPPTLSGTVPRVAGVYKVGKPYVIQGVTYVPSEDPTYDKTGIASWYGTDFHGKPTANGEIYDMNLLSAAHPTLPLPSYLYVTNLGNGRTVLVRLNDRGPYKHGRIIDMSRAAARALGFEGNGVASVRVQYAGRAPLEPNDHHERKFLTAQPWSRGLARQPYGLGMASRAAASD